MRALVTGAAGFIGSHLCNRLLTEGYEVVGFDDFSEGSKENLASAPEAMIVEGDLRDAELLSRAAQGCHVIFHQAGIRSVPKSIEFPRLTTDVNVIGMLNVLLVAREEKAIVVSASSSSVYGDQEEFPLHEEMHSKPRSPYAASKLAMEIYGQAWWRGFGVRTVSLRYFNVYGPRQDPSSQYAVVVPRFIMACLTGERSEIHGDGDQARDFTYIDDVVEGNILAARAGDRTWGCVLNIGGGRTPTSVNQLLSLISEVTGTSVEPIHTPPRAGDVRFTQANVGQAEELIGYVPNVAIEEGLRRTVEWFRESLSRRGAQHHIPASHDRPEPSGRSF
jgi:nucleoside-diphosphate-sugar epimerase